MENQTFENVWDALSDTPEEATHMTMKSDLLIAIQEAVRAWRLTQAKAAERLGVTQPRLNDLLRGKISNFSLETLIELSTRAGLSVSLEIKPMALEAA
jgi:predicted XRE-type DNA-binding protein